MKKWFFLLLVLLSAASVAVAGSASFRIDGRWYVCGGYENHDVFDNVTAAGDYFVVNIEGQQTIFSKNGTVKTSSESTTMDTADLSDDVFVFYRLFKYDWSKERYITYYVFYKSGGKTICRHVNDGKIVLFMDGEIYDKDTLEKQGKYLLIGNEFIMSNGKTSTSGIADLLDFSFFQVTFDEDPVITYDRDGNELNYGKPMYIFLRAAALD